jgi:hypothetical protein
VAVVAQMRPRSTGRSELEHIAPCTPSASSQRSWTRPSTTSGRRPPISGGAPSVAGAPAARSRHPPEREALKQHLASQLEIVRQTEIARTDYTIRAPFGAGVESKYIFEGELATPGSPVAGLLRPQDRYVRVYVPVTELDRVRVGTDVRIELDSVPGTSYAGRITFIANQTQFTPKNIETRDDRVTQVYEAKATILEGVEHFKPGAEGNVYVQLGRRRETSTSVPVAAASPRGSRP